MLAGDGGARHMIPMSTDHSPGRRRQKCPLCGKPAGTSHAPFCSQGCRDRDLLNWLGDSYRAPGPPAEEAGGEFGGGGVDSEG